MNLSEANLFSHQERVTRWQLNMTLNLFVGFEEEPTGLEYLMRKRGYTSIEKHKDYLIFERASNPWPRVFYSPHVEKVDNPEDGPNWDDAGFDVVSEVNINFPHSDIPVWSEATELSDQLVRELQGILYDPEADEYSTKADI